MRKLVTRSSILATLIVGGIIVVSCGGSDSSDTPCEGALKSKCGKDCGVDADCGAGTYCGPGGKCTADCIDQSDCGSGQICTPNGKCLTGIQLDGGSGTGGGSGDGCIDLDVTFEKQIPTVVLLIDQSGSMTEAFGGAGTRWDVVKNALMDQQTGSVKVLENDVRFGLALYTSHEGNQGGQCPIITDVGPSLGNYSAIQAVYGPAAPDDETPTGESIDEVVKVLVPYAEPGPKAIVLATDGEPDTCAEPNPQNGQAVSIKAAQDAFAADISTYVISVGADVSLGHLQDMANAGVGLPVGGSQNAPFYQALDQAALVKAFNDIIYGVRPCTYKLNGTVDASQAGKGSVILDSQPLGYQDPDGWQLKAPDELELVGAACAAIKSGDHSLSISFPCGAFTPPPTK